MTPPREHRSPPDRTDKGAILREHYLFGKLTSQHVDRLSACIVMKSAKRDTNIFAKGDPGSSLFAIAAGTVKISVPSGEGKVAHPQPMRDRPVAHPLAFQQLDAFWRSAAV